MMRVYLMLPTLLNFVYNWTIFHGRKWLNKENYHLVTLLTTELEVNWDRHFCKWRTTCYAIFLYCLKFGKKCYLTNATNKVKLYKRTFSIRQARWPLGHHHIQWIPDVHLYNFANVILQSALTAKHCVPWNKGPTLIIHTSRLDSLPIK